MEYIERTYLQLSDEIKKLKLLVDNKDKSELDFFRYLKPLKREHKASIKQQVRKKFQAAVRKFTEMHRKDKNCLPNALLALRDIMRERRRKQKEILHLQRINTIKYLQEKSPLIHPSQDMNSQGVNMFINQTINNQYNIQNLNLAQTQAPAPSGSMNPKDQEELEMLRKMDEEARKEKAKTNQNLSKLLSLIEVHNGTLEDIEAKFKKEFSDIKKKLSEEGDKVRLMKEESLRAQQEQNEKFEIERQFMAEQLKKEQSKVKQSSILEGDEEEKVARKITKAKKGSSKKTLKDLYPQQNQIISNEYSNSIDHDDIGLFSAPQNTQLNENKFTTQAVSKKRTSKRADGVSKNHGLKAPRDSTEMKKAPPDPHSFGDEDETPVNPKFMKNDSDSYMLKQKQVDKEIDLTEEEEFEKENTPKHDLQAKSESESSEEEDEDQQPDQESSKSQEEEEEELKKEIHESFKQNIGNDDQKKLSEASFEESSIDENHEQDIQDEEQLHYQENMPRLNEDEAIVEIKKSKKKKRKIKFKRGNKQSQQEMDIMMREQANKKEKVNLAKNSKPKKSYHAYLEHPRMRHQPSYQSPRRQKAEEDDEFGMAARPRKR